MAIYLVHYCNSKIVIFLSVVCKFEETVSLQATFNLFYGFYSFSKFGKSNMLCLPSLHCVFICISCHLVAVQIEGHKLLHTFNFYWKHFPLNFSHLPFKQCHISANRLTVFRAIGPDWEKVLCRATHTLTTV